MKMVKYLSRSGKIFLSLVCLFLTSALTSLGIVICGIVNTIAKPIWSPPQPLFSIMLWTMVGSIAIAWIMVVAKVFRNKGAL